MSDTTRTRNRLASESSPYLLLHAGNPVDWYPWGDEAFEKARREDKPVFLSVGYSTCYWCHVMERESFSNPEIAAALNAGFVSIKLDREERPDLDEIYMTATQLLTRQGGWPNSLFLTHDRKPFFAGTYFPPDDRMGRPGFPRVLASLSQAWRSRRADVVEQAEALAQAIRDSVGGSAPDATPRAAAEAVVATQAALARRFDPESGGFGSAPKFPSPSNLDFLLDRARAGDDAARRMLVTTLDGMARGGIHDQIGGGFHRYSTDAEWLVPHFEKMLYDNAALGVLYAEAAALAPDAGFERVARHTLDFVLAELLGDEGGYLSAIDAETDGHEGAYYSWSRDELEAVLDPEGRRLLGSVYGFDGRPNFEGSRYVLHLPLPLAEQAQQLGTSTAELLARIEPGRAALLAARFERKRPLVDDKVLCDWNGLMIAAMARAGKALGEPRYAASAARAARFLLQRLVDPAGILLHAYRAGSAKIPALLDDYAFLVSGLLALHETSGDASWLAEARRLAAQQDARLWDASGAGYFVAGEDPALLVRPKTATDGAMASGNGVAALNLIALFRLTRDAAYLDRARALVAAFAAAAHEWPLACVTIVQAAARLDAERTPSPADEAAGVVDARARLLAPRSAGRFELELTIREGWHLNANPASLPSLVATDVSAGSGALRGVRYPPGTPLDTAAPEPVSVYARTVRIEGEIEAAGEAPMLRITYQACDASRCLAPVTKDVPLD